MNLLASRLLLAAGGVVLLVSAQGLPIDNALAAPGDITEYPIPAANASPAGIAAGPDGNLWFTEQGGNYVAKVTPAGTFTEYPIPTANAGAFGIVAGPDGNVWFTEGQANKVAKVTPSGSFTEYPIVTADSGPQGITLGPDGNLWFTEGQANKVAKVTPSGILTEYAITTPDSFPQGIALGPDGNLWFTENAGNNVGKVTISGTITEYSIPTADSNPYGIAAGRDGNLWFTEDGGTGQVARVTPSGSVTEYPIPTANSFPGDITMGSDGDLWFTEGQGNKVARMTIAGAITEYPLLVANGFPVGMAAGPDGNIWFTEGGGDAPANKLGKIQVDVQPVLVAAVGSDNVLWQRQNGGGWSSPGGLLLAGPAIVSIPNGNVGAPLYIGVGRDHDLWVRTAGNSWRPLNNLPIYCVDNPAATVSGGILYVACQGGDHHLYSAHQQVVPNVPPVFDRASWQNLGGILMAGPAVAVVPGRGIDIMVVGLNNNVYEFYNNSYNADGFKCIGHPALATDPAGVTYFGCHGIDGALWSSKNNGGAWFNTKSLGGMLLDGPAIAATHQVPTFYVEGLDHALYERGLYGGYRSDGGYIQYGTGAAALF